MSGDEYTDQDDQPRDVEPVEPAQLDGAPDQVDRRSRQLRSIAECVLAGLALGFLLLRVILRVPVNASAASSILLIVLGFGLHFSAGVFLGGFVEDRAPGQSGVPRREAPQE